MKNLSAATCAAPLQGLLATAALHALAVQSFDAETAPTLAPSATDLDTGQPKAISFDAKALPERMQHARRDSASPPISTIRGKRVIGTDKSRSVDYHRQLEVTMN